MEKAPYGRGLLTDLDCLCGELLRSLKLLQGLEYSKEETQELSALRIVFFFCRIRQELKASIHGQRLETILPHGQNQNSTIKGGYMKASNVPTKATNHYLGSRPVPETNSRVGVSCPMARHFCGEGSLLALRPSRVGTSGVRSLLLKDTTLLLDLHRPTRFPYGVPENSSFCCFLLGLKPSNGSP